MGRGIKGGAGEFTDKSIKAHNASVEKTKLSWFFGC
jgi:hypothetical protein